jgi:1,4-dihydroxy-2-naphthoate octaprenyltransferase
VRLKPWFLETRPQFLTLSVILAFLGTTIAWYHGYLSLGRAILAGFGLVLTHASVNIINDYFDFKSGIDLAAKRTPFSGGSGILPAGLLTPQQVLWLGTGALAIAVPIGIYFTVISGWQLLPLLLVAAFFIILYSPFILKRPWPEWVAGAGLGMLPILGLYFVQSGAYTWQALVASVPSFFLVHNLLLLNEFPDAEADTKANRKTLPLTIGKKSAAAFYTVAAIAVYVWIFAWAMARVFPAWTLLALLTIPLELKAIDGAIHNDAPAKLMSGMAMNVMTVLLTQFLMGIGFILGRAI